MLDVVQTQVTKALPEKISPVPTRVLVVDDDPSIRELIVDYLGNNDIQVTAIASGREIAEVTSRELVDLLILDLRLPGEDGIEIARRIRADSNMPIIMLTGRKEEADRVMGLELGADDYLTKPFSPRELLARIRSLLRRSRAHQTVAEGLTKIRAYRFAGWELNVRIRRLKSPEGEVVELRNAEFNLLAVFLALPQRVLTREQLITMSHLHNDEVYDRAVDSQIARLRRKLEEHGASQELIHTERGAGYILTVPVEVVFE
jgi:DNA-binding response OmpR family regulator